MKEKIGATIYHERLMDHYRHPRNAGHINNPDFSSGLINPSCGDSIQWEGIIDHADHDVITALAFSGNGCVISQAAASMLSEYVLHVSRDVIMNINKEDMVRLLGIELGPLRLQCALLSLQALHQALVAYKKEENGRKSDAQSGKSNASITRDST